jgi:flagellar operon protein
VEKLNGVLAGRPAAGAAPTLRPGGDGGDFKRLLEDLGGAPGIKFSKHAVERMSSRGISLDRMGMDKLEAAVKAAGDKGANESLLLMDELDRVVSVRNRTVITAMPKGESRGNVFTSIDSTVIA